MSEFKPEDIGRVKTTVPDSDFDVAQSNFYSRLSAELQTKLADAEGKIKQLKAENLIAETRATLMMGSEKKVFRFVVCYCLGVFVLLLLEGGFKWFTLPPTVLSIIAGSTAVAALGLVGIVLNGLFGVNKPNQ